MSPRATLQPPVVVDNAFGGVNGTFETPLKPLRADCYLPDSLSIFAIFPFSSLCPLIRIETQRRHSIHDKHARRRTYALHLSRFPGLVSSPLFLLSTFSHPSLFLAFILASTGLFSPRISLSIIMSNPIPWDLWHFPPLVFFEKNDKESREKLSKNVAKLTCPVLTMFGMIPFSKEIK